jgi:hypothetical protein
MCHPVIVVANGIRPPMIQVNFPISETKNIVSKKKLVAGSEANRKANS